MTDLIGHLEGETKLPFREAFVGLTDDRMTLSTFIRWAVHGTKLPDGKRLKLEAIRVGTRWLTSREAARRFVNASTAARLPAEAVAVRSPAQRRKASEKAEAELKAMGC